MLADFIITIHEARKPLAVQVKVHDSTAALRGAAIKYAKRTGYKKEGDYSDTLGVCHRFHKQKIDKTGKWEPDPLCAIVRLAPPYIDAGIVAHEMGHAAIHLWAIQTVFDDTKLSCENDEWFCWVLGELVRQTTIVLLEKGIYQSDQARTTLKNLSPVGNRRTDRLGINVV